ncbi:unnamed protein product [Oncorhynchus mykiss]|uniref:Uncharacterized protein n=1 Tax=Oncorhynchus mykiss TaxID=8022 RepID=A0A060WH75_ONCMY|nr:unnamed protein product [Oncorhynchus mykiss]
MKSKELSIELRDRIVSRHRTWEWYQNISAALKVPKNTVAAIIFLKWTKFGTTKTLPRAVCPTKLSNLGRRALVRELQSSSVEMGEPSVRTTISAALHQLGLYGREARRKLLPSKRHMTACLEFAERLMDFQTMSNKIFWSDETKIELFHLSAKRCVWRKPGTIPMGKHGGGGIMLLGCFSAAGTGRLVRIKGMMNGAKYKEILDENLTCQQDIDPKHTAKTTEEWLLDKSP